KRVLPVSWTKIKSLNINHENKNESISFSNLTEILNQNWIDEIPNFHVTKQIRDPEKYFNDIMLKKMPQPLIDDFLGKSKKICADQVPLKFCNLPARKLWVEEIKKKGNLNPVLYYKQQGSIDIALPNFTVNDFCLIIMTPLQTELFIKFGTDKVCVDDPDTVDFGKYFEKCCSTRVEKWAMFNRKHVGINTNMYLESLHKNIKYCYLEGKHCKRLDMAINALMSLVRDKSFERTGTDKIIKKDCEIKNKMEIMCGMFNCSNLNEEDKDFIKKHCDKIISTLFKGTRFKKPVNETLKIKIEPQARFWTKQKVQNHQPALSSTEAKHTR
ncbi:MULE domain-containing protein, partial [Aphis craccivora]